MGGGGGGGGGGSASRSEGTPASSGGATGLSWAPRRAANDSATSRTKTTARMSEPDEELDRKEQAGLTG